MHEEQGEQESLRSQLPNFELAFQIHAVYAAHQQSQTSLYSIHANVQERFGTFTRIGECARLFNSLRFADY